MDHPYTSDSYDSTYRRLLKATMEGRLGEEVRSLRENRDMDEQELDLLLHPENRAAVVHLPGDCVCPPDGMAQCQLGCLFNAIERDSDGKIRIRLEDCTGCADCIESCTDGKLRERRDLVPLFEALRERKAPVFAMVAPAFIGQFSAAVTVGKLRHAFKRLGFQGMVEVALFADILTLKEALEFDRLVKTEQDFLLTSCCCPVWVGMIRRVYGTLASHIPPSVSPMVACGRAIKQIHRDAVTVFVGPCLAKKAEARERDVADAVDFVLTFQEVKDILDAAEFDIAGFPDDERDHSSTAGRIYARTGGVSQAVRETLAKLKGSRDIPLVARQAEGVPQCKALLELAANGPLDANFLEGMGCVGGCVGGPRVMIDPGEGTANVNAYGAEATYETPVDNPYTFEFLRRLGYDSAESLLEQGSMFIRDFSAKESLNK